MKGICHVWSRGRHFSPSLPGNRYRKLISKSDLRAEISGSIVRYNALAPRSEVLRPFSDFYANDARWVFFLRKHKFSKIDLSHPLFYMRVRQRTKLAFRTSTFRMMAFSSTQMQMMRSGIFHSAQAAFIRATLSADVNLNKHSKDCSLRAAHFLIMQIEKQIPNCMFEGCKTFTHVMNLNIECLFCLCLFLLSTCKRTRLFPRLVQPAPRNILLWFLCVVIAAVIHGKLKGLKNQVTEIPDS